MAVVAVVLFGVAINVAVGRNDNAVKTVGKDATSSIAGQRIKVNLADFDDLVVEDLLNRSALSTSGLPADYDTQPRRAPVQPGGRRLRRAGQPGLRSRWPISTTPWPTTTPW